MANKVIDLFGTRTALTITLASLASSTVGVGRQSTLVDNTTTRHHAAVVYCKVTVGTTPTINRSIYVYLVRYDDSAIGDDAVGATDAAQTIVNAKLLGVIAVNSASSDLSYYGVFDTSGLGALGPKWGITIVHDTVAALNATGSNHVIAYIGYDPEVQ